MTGTRQARVLYLPAIALLIAACSDQPLTTPDDSHLRAPAEVEIISGQDQTAIAGSPLPTELMLKVLDATGRPLPGELVNYRVTSGEGKVTVDTATTDESGIARGQWILGPEPGSNTLEALILDRKTLRKLIQTIFRAKGVRPAPKDEAAALEVISGQSQRATVGSTLPEALVVRVVNGKGQPVPGQVVDYQVTAGGGSLEVSGEVTDEAGSVEARWTLGAEPGKNTVAARIVNSATGKASSSVIFTAEGVKAPTEPKPPEVATGECSNPGAGWIWCDDFEQDRLDQYFEYSDGGGSFVRTAEVGIDESHGMRARWGSAGQVSAGALRLAFGKTPQSYVRPVDSGKDVHREIYWRVYVKYPTDWAGGGGYKLSRAQSLASTSWAQAMVAPVWSGGSASSRDHLVIDPVSGTSEHGALRTTSYGDEANLRYLGVARSKTPIFAQPELGQWHCVEARVRLNDSGQSNGTFELWIDDALEAQRTGLNWVGSYSDYGINTVYLENYWNDGAPKAQERYFDNLVVSTSRIGCGSAPVTPPPTVEEPPAVGSVTVLPSQPALRVGQSIELTAWVYDVDGKEMAGKTVEWATSDASVVRVVSTGAITARLEGVATGTVAVTAAVEGKTRAIAASVSRPESPSPGTPAPWVDIDFSKYSSTADLLAGGGGLVGGDKPGISLDMSTGYGASSRSMVYTYPDKTNDPRRCENGGISRTVRLPEKATEVWVEIVAKFSENFTTKAPSEWGCTNNPDLKFIFGLVTSNDSRGESRFGLYNGVFGSSWHAGYPGNEPAYNNSTLPSFAKRPLNWDNKWHRYRFHWKISTDGQSNGIFRMWIDDDLVVNDTAIYTANNYGVPTVGIYGISLGATMNQGQGHEQHLWWGAVRAWNRNPGW